MRGIRRQICGNPRVQRLPVPTRQSRDHARKSGIHSLDTCQREGTALKRAAGRFSTGPDVPEVAILGLPSPHLPSGPGGMAPGVGEDKILTCRDFTLASCGVSGRGRRMLSGRDLMRGSRAMPDCNSGLSMPCTGNGSSRGAHLALWRRARPERLAGRPLCSSCASATAPPTRKSRSRRPADRLDRQLPLRTGRSRFRRPWRAGTKPAEVNTGCAVGYMSWLEHLATCPRSDAAERRARA